MPCCWRYTHETPHAAQPSSLAQQSAVSMQQQQPLGLSSLQQVQPLGVSSLQDSEPVSLPLQQVRLNSPLWNMPFAYRCQYCGQRPVPAEICQQCPQLCAGCSWTCKSCSISILQMPAPLILLQHPLIDIAELCIALTSFLMHAGAHSAGAA